MGCARGAGAASWPRPARAAESSNRSQVGTRTTSRYVPAAPTARSGHADSAGGPAGSRAAATMGSPISATPASRCHKRSAATASSAGRARSLPARTLSAPNAPHGPQRPARTVGTSVHRQRAGPRARSVTPATPQRCAVGAPAPAAASNAGWLTLPGRRQPSARTAPPRRPHTSPPRTYAPTAPQRTSSTSVAGAPDARCAVEQVSCCTARAT